jgi:hypothetical protein
MTDDARFTDWFKQATRNEPYPYQTRFACEPSLFRKPSPLVGEGKGEGGEHQRVTRCVAVPLQ